MSQSWYVESGCIVVDEMHPLSLLFFGCFIQVITNIILFYDFLFSEYDQIQIPELTTSINDSRKESQCGRALSIISGRIWNCMKRIRDNKCFKLFKYALFLWQFVSVLGIIYFDTHKMTEHFGLYHSSWSQYQCYAAIILTSSNAKTLFVYGCMVQKNTNYFLNQMYGGSNRIKIGVIYAFCFLGLALLISISLYWLPAALVYCWIFVLWLSIMYLPIYIVSAITAWRKE
eukprot:778171_1